MTIIRGVYCCRCRVRYAYHVCRDGLPCDHHKARVVYGGFIGPARVIYLESWRYLEGFQRFEMQEFYYRYNKESGGFEKLWNEKLHFKLSYVSADDVIDAFLKFMREKLDVSDWVDWVGAFSSLFMGGRSLTYPPAWRLKQMVKESSMVDEK